MLDHRLKLFIKVADAGSFTTVAGEEYISQPAVSKAIASLENELGVKVFHRDRRNGLRITEVGEQILELARASEDLDQRMYQTAWQANHLMKGTLRIASLPILSTMLLSRLLPTYREMYPDVSVEILEGSPRQLRQMVRTHRADVALSCSPFEDLDHEILIHDKMVGLFSPNLKDPPKQIDLRKGRPELIAVRSAVETALETLPAKQKADFSDCLLVEDYMTVIRMVEEGNGVAIISQFTLDSVPNTLDTCDIVPEIPIDIGIEAISLTDLVPAADAFVSLLRV